MKFTNFVNNILKWEIWKIRNESKLFTCQNNDIQNSHELMVSFTVV